MTAPTPNPPRRDSNAVRRFAARFARDIMIVARIIELRRLAEQTARGEVPAPDDVRPSTGITHDERGKTSGLGDCTRNDPTPKRRGRRGERI
jgi:hypothetical protein